MKLRVHCVNNDVPRGGGGGGGGPLQMVMECGEGEQTLKWLTLAVAQRYSYLKIPQGRYRAREHSTTPQGFYLPTGLTSKAFVMDGATPLSHYKIKDVLQDGDDVEVTIKYELSLDEVGSPVLTDWAKEAFFYKETHKERDPEVERRMIAAENMLELCHMLDDSDARRLSVEMRVVITGHIETPSEVRAALAYDWPIMRVTELDLPPPVLVLVREVFQERFKDLNAVFLYFCGLPRLGDECHGITYHDFTHLLHRSGVLHADKDRNMIHKIFSSCATSVGAMAVTASTTITTNTNTTIMTRGQFLGALARIAKALPPPPPPTTTTDNSSTHHAAVPSSESASSSSSTTDHHTPPASTTTTTTTKKRAGGGGASSAPAVVSSLAHILAKIAAAFFPDQQQDPVAYLLRTKLSAVIDSHRSHLWRIFQEHTKPSAAAATNSHSSNIKEKKVVAGGGGGGGNQDDGRRPQQPSQATVLTLRRFCKMLVAAGILAGRADGDNDDDNPRTSGGGAGGKSPPRGGGGGVMRRGASAKDDDDGDGDDGDGAMMTMTMMMRKKRREEEEGEGEPLGLEAEQEAVVLTALSAMGYAPHEAKSMGLVFAEFIEAACRAGVEASTRQYSAEQKAQLALSSLLDIGETAIL